MEEIEDLKMKLARLRAEIDWVDRLLEDPHPGLFGWNLMLGRRLDSLKAVARDLV